MAIKTRTSGIMVNINVEPATVTGWAGVTDQLTHHWPMDDTNVSGTTITDIVGGLNGTANGAGVTSAVGPSGAAGTARQFNGVNFISFASNVYTNMAGVSYTICAWVYNPDVTVNGPDGSSGFFYNFTDGTNATSLATAPSASPAVFACGAISGNEGGHDSNAIATNNTWFFISMTHVAGQNITQGHCFSGNTDQVGGANPSETSSITFNGIGARAATSHRLLTGSRVGRVLTYTKVLSSAELLQNFNAF